MAQKKRKLKNIKSKRKIKGGATSRVRAMACLDPGSGKISNASKVKALTCHDNG